MEYTLYTDDISFVLINSFNVMIVCQNYATFFFIIQME